jgi:hypothetical protein
MVVATKAERPMSVQLADPSPGREAMGEERRFRPFVGPRWSRGFDAQTGPCAENFSELSAAEFVEP